MNKLLKMTILGASMLSMFSLSSKAPVKTKAEDTLTRVGIIYEAGKDSGDLGYVYTPVIYNGTVSFKRNVLIGFDSKEDVDQIYRMHFRLTYRVESFWDKLRNDWLISNGQPPKHGRLEETTEMVSYDTSYSYKVSYTPFGPNGEIPRKGTYENEAKLSFDAIGLISDLLEAERIATSTSGHSTSSDFNKFFPTGGHNFKSKTNFHTERINDPKYSLSLRKYYAVIPMNWVEEIAPESISVLLADGTLISDGLDEDGNPFKDEYGTFIEAKVSKDFGVAINGADAKLTRIRVTNFPTSSNAVVLLQNAGYDKEKHEIINIKNTLLVNENINKIYNWEINELNPYVFIKFDNASDLDLSSISIKFYYTNSDNKVAFLINVTDQDGNFLPPPLIPTRPEETPAITWKELFVAFGFLVAAAIALVIIYDIFRQVIRRA